METMFRLFFDLTLNDGWNGVAMGTYTLFIGLIILAIYEGKQNND